MRFPQHYKWLRLVETRVLLPPLAFGRSLGRDALPRVHSRPWQGPSPVAANDHTGDHTTIGIRCPELSTRRPIVAARHANICIGSVCRSACVALKVAPV